jgi:acetyltransferase-like isoleucine patch superfamily enzyme
MRSGRGSAPVPARVRCRCTCVGRSRGADPMIRSLARIARLRRQGMVIAWSADIGTNDATRLSFGRGCEIRRGAMLELRDGELALGDETLIGAYSNIRAGNSFVRVGSRVQLAQFVSLVAVDHLVNEEGVPQRHEHDLRSGHHGIVIGNDCWLAAQSIVLPGVSLGDRCVVAAGAVVTRSHPAGCTLAGVPAKVIGQH